MAGTHSTIFIDTRTRDQVEALNFTHQRTNAKVGETLSARIYPEGRRWFVVKHIEEGYVRKVYVEKKAIHWTDMVLLAVIAPLAWYVFYSLFDFLY